MLWRRNKTKTCFDEIAFPDFNVPAAARTNDKKYTALYSVYRVRLPSYGIPEKSNYDTYLNEPNAFSIQKKNHNQMKPAILLVILFVRIEWWWTEKKEK